MSVAPGHTDSPGLSKQANFPYVTDFHNWYGRIFTGDKQMSEFAYENMKRKVYEEGATFVPVCEKCGRFVKADEFVLVNEIQGLSKEPNATCKKDGRTRMIFEGFI